MAEVDNCWAQDQISILGTLLQGEENRRDGVDFSDVDASAGISPDLPGPASPEKNRPVRRESTPRRRARSAGAAPQDAFSLNTKLLGDVTGRVNGALALFDQRWVMR